MTAYADQMLWPLGKVRALARKGDQYIALIECAHCGRENDVPLNF